MPDVRHNPQEFDGGYEEPDYAEMSSIFDEFDRWDDVADEYGEGDDWDEDDWDEYFVDEDGYYAD